MSKFYVLIISILFFSVNLKAAELSGIVKDSKTNTALLGATVTLSIDSTFKYGEKTNSSGKFNFENVKPGTYLLKISFIGYAKYEQSIKLTNKSKENLGTISLEPEEIKSGEVIVEAKMPIGETKEDTTIFNAGAYKTNPDATAEDLVKKMPGVQVDNSGTVKSQGESVKKVLVDGKPFFGDDPTVALKNIPADVIDKIQIYDKLSDQAEFSGFDDGNTDKTMNIITKSFKRYGQFGKAYGGYGTDDKYAASLNMNIFNGDMRWSILGMSNNVNQSNFSIEDIVGAYGGGGNRMPRPPGMGQPSKKMMSNSELRPSGGMFDNVSSFMVSPSDGIAKTNSIGTNFTDLWFNDKVEFSGSYFFNKTNNENSQTNLKDYFLTIDTTQNYDQSGDASSVNYNHRLNFRIKYDINEDNSLMLRNNLSFQDYESYGNYLSNTTLNKLTNINSAYGNYGSAYDGINFSNTVSYRHRFDTAGRIVTVNLSTSYNKKDGNSYNKSYTTYYSYTPFLIDTIDQQADNNSKTLGYGLDLTYAEPLSTKSQLQLIYSANLSNSESDTKTNAYNLLTDSYSILDSTLSNKTESNYFTQKAGVTYKLKGSFYNLSFGVNYQNSSLNSDQTFPYTLNTKRTFDNILPNAQLRFKFDQRTNLRLEYRTSTIAPSISQLQDVIDNSNSTQLSSGNINLKPQYSNTFNIRFHNMSENMSNIFMTMFAVNIRNNYITNSYLIAKQDTMLNPTTKLSKGSQFTKPINLDGYWDTRAFINYGFPFELISSNLNLGTGITYTRTPSLINNVESKSDAWTATGMFNLGSNISENLDFNANLQYNYNITKNKTSSNYSSEYSSIGVGFDLNWIIWEGFFINANFRSMFYTGDNISSSSSDYKLLNMSIGKKLFNNMFELKFTANDILDNNKSYSTDYSEYYTQITTNTVLKKYFILSLTFNLKNFTGGNSNFGPGGREPFRPHNL